MPVSNTEHNKLCDEVMLYYDFCGGARIPNLKIDGKSYDEYIESLYYCQVKPDLL